MDKPRATVFRADSVSLLNLVVKYWKVLIITAFCVLVVSAAATFLIKPLYRATVVLYPTINVTETQSLFGLQSKLVPLFGEEESTEKVLQVLKSDMIKDYIVKKYDLLNHYGISPGARYRYTLLEAKLRRYIQSAKTQYNSIEVSVLDPDPVTSAAIANDISHRVDTVFNSIVQDAGRRAEEAISKSYLVQLKRVKALEDSIHSSVPAELVKAMPQARGSQLAGTSWAPAAGQYGPEFLRLINMFQAENESLSAIRNKLTEARMTATQVMPYTHIINDAKVPEKKALPARTLIVMASVLTSLVLLIFILAAGEMITRNE
ncbi:MAG TPA: Wzz/FepE/Etk N-terminal domain-containing protein [Bacteroidales bacterium]|nr:Wzz/FepE/Etk N-terminal domain-containing protein [Bacteroidales bacterium]